MADPLQFPGLVGATIGPAKERLDPSFGPGEQATIEDVRRSIAEMFLSAYLGPGTTPQRPMQSRPVITGREQSPIGRQARSVKTFIRRAEDFVGGKSRRQIDRRAYDAARELGHLAFKERPDLKSEGDR